MKSIVSLIVGVSLLCSTILSYEGDSERRATEWWMKTADYKANLHTRMIFPRGFDPLTSKNITAIFDRSPYGYWDLEWIADILVPFGFVAIGQDMRGTGTSSGNFTIWHTEAEDGNQLGDWIASQPWSDGKIYTFGASADGMAELTVPSHHPKWLKGQYVVWSTAEAHRILFPNGAYCFALADNWLRSTVRARDLDDTFAEFYDNEAQTGWWEPLEMEGEYDDQVLFPSGFWAGWYDIFLGGTLATYDGFMYKAAEGHQMQSRLLVDPLGHCQDAAVYFPQDLVDGRTLLALVQMLEVYGVAEVKRSGIDKVTFYVMSSNDDAGLEVGNFWTSNDKFPDFKETKFYLHSDGTTNTEPSVKTDKADELSTTYTYDPANPVLGNGGNNLSPLACGPLEQFDTEDGRDDVLQFDTDIYDEAMYLTGPISATLFVATSAIDTDFTVKVSDVYPSNSDGTRGSVRLLQDSAFRMRWRENGLTPTPTEPGKIYEIQMTLWNTSYVVAPGHKLRISVSSSNYPRISINPNNMLLLNDTNYPGENITAQNTLYHSSDYPSHVSLPVVTKADLPKLNDVKLIKERLMESHPAIKEEGVLDSILERAKNVFGPRIPKSI